MDTVDPREQCALRILQLTVRFRSIRVSSNSDRPRLDLPGIVSKIIGYYEFSTLIIIIGILSLLNLIAPFA